MNLEDVLSEVHHLVSKPFQRAHSSFLEVRSRILKLVTMY